MAKQIALKRISITTQGKHDESNKIYVTHSAIDARGL